MSLRLSHNNFQHFLKQLGEQLGYETEMEYGEQKVDVVWKGKGLITFEIDIANGKEKIKANYIKCHNMKPYKHIHILKDKETAEKVSDLIKNPIIVETFERSFDGAYDYRRFLDDFKELANNPIRKVELVTELINRYGYSKKTIYNTLKNAEEKGVLERVLAATLNNPMLIYKKVEGIERNPV